MRNFIKFLIILVPLIYLGCKENQDNEVWPPNYSDDAERPVITSIYPDPSTINPDLVSMAGVGVIFIEGENFADNIGDNRVFFDGTMGTVLEASSTLLRVRVANVVGDSIKIHLNSKGALLYADYNGKDFFSPFKTKNAAPGYFAIDQNLDVSGMGVDANENVYVLTTDKNILKISHPDSDAVEYGTSIFIVTPCIRMGPDTVLYITRGTKSLYTVRAPEYKTKKLLSMNNNIAHIDFDENKNLFAGGKGETIELLKASDGTDETVANYTDHVITSLKVYDGYVYVSAEYNGDDSLAVQEGIWKNEILDAEGNLGSNELVFDWASFAGENGPAISSFTFDEDGEMYIGQSKEGAIYLLNEGRYLYPEILDAPATTITWGNGNYLYYNKHSDDPTERTLVRVELTKKGAIYYGR